MRTFGILLIAAALAAAQGPRLFFTDLESGPNNGGENNAGVYVTVWGRNFGASRGPSRVTAGGGVAAAYPVWTDTRITFQIGSAAATGQIVLTTAGGTSNALSFTVRSGNIYFVSPGGNDAADGSFAHPWRTLIKAKNTMAAGDVTDAPGRPLSPDGLPKRQPPFTSKARAHGRMLDPWRFNACTKT